MISRFLLTPSTVLVLGFALAGCVASKSHSTSQVADAGATATPAAPTITYHNKIAQIFQSRCVPCHYQGDGVQIVGGFAEATFQGAKKPYFTDYASVKQLAPVALAVMKSGFMPPAKNLGATDVADLQAWIKAGRPEGDPATEPPPAMSAKAILDRRCVACHYPGGGVDLTTYDSASGIHSPIIYAALNVLKNMPPAKNLTTDEFNALSTWTSAGGPQDGYDGTVAPPAPP